MHGVKLTDLQRNTCQVGKEMKLLIDADIVGKLFVGKVINLKSNLTCVQTQLRWTV